MDNMLWEDYLFHHGIKGQKWGVKNGPPYPLDFHSDTHGDIKGQSRDKDIVLKKGSKAYRVSSVKEKDEGTKYVSFDELDHYTYLSGAAAGVNGIALSAYRPIEGGDEDRRIRSITMVLDKDLVIPSYEKTMEKFIETFEDIKVKDFAKEYLYKKRSDGSIYDKSIAKEFINNMKHKKVEKCLDQAYISFASTFMKDTKAKETFFNKLKEEGYNAIVDDNDAKFGNGYTKSPVIIFESKGAVSKKKELVLTDEDYEYLAESYFGPVSMNNKFKNLGLKEFLDKQNE